jgi:hypothetical protein
MKIDTQPSLPAYVAGVPAELRDVLMREFRTIREVLSGRVGLDTMEGVLIQTTSHATPSTEWAIEHSLGRIPLIYIPNLETNLGTTSCSLYKGSTAWTESTMYLKCTAASVAMTLFVL